MKQLFPQIQNLRLNLLAVSVGVLAGYSAILFRGLIGFIQNISFHNSVGFALTSPMTNDHGVWIIFLPAIGLTLSSIIVWKFAKEAKGHGVPEVIEAVLAHNGKMRKRLVFVKAISSAITIGTGGSVGREGPIVQIGSAAASSFGQLFKLSSHDLKILVGCGAAGAIAATFNTPIAAVIFSIELIILELNSKSFIPLVISAVFAAIISRIHVGNTPAFIVSQHTLHSPLELIFYLLLGLICGLMGFLVIKTVYGTEDFIDKLRVPFVLKAILGGLIIGVVGYYFPQIFGVGYETIDKVLHEGMSLKLLIALAGLKILMSSITLGAGGSGGVFAPSLFIGAMTGGAFGILVHSLFPESTASYGAYALVGMAAVFASTSRATFTSIVILFEMTLDYSIILPLMFACVIADQVSCIIGKDNTIYSIKLKRKGTFFIEGFEVNILKITPLSKIMSKIIDTLPDDIAVKDAFKIVSKTIHGAYPVINKQGYAIGIISAREIIQQYHRSNSDAIISTLIKRNPILGFPSDSAFSALKKLDKKHDSRVLVIDPITNKLLGIVCPHDFSSLTKDSE